MPKLNTFELCRRHLFDDQIDIDHLAHEQQSRLLRIRSGYTLWNSNPNKRPKEIYDHIRAFSNVGKDQAYDDVRIIEQLLGEINKQTKDWHRYKFNYMVLEAFEIAKLKQDPDAMQKASNTYAKYNQLDKEDPLKVPWDKIIPQLFEPTEDPSVLGIKPIENIKEKIAAMKKKYMDDIEDVTYESIDIEQLQKYDQQ